MLNFKEKINYLKGGLRGLLSGGGSYISNLNINYLDPEAQRFALSIPLLWIGWCLPT